MRLIPVLALSTLLALPALAGPRAKRNLEDPEVQELQEYRELHGVRPHQGWVVPDDMEQVQVFVQGPRLGIETNEMTPELRAYFGADDAEGVLVARVLPDTAAEKARLKVGDVIVAVDDRAIARTSDIRRALHDRDGDKVRITVIRKGQPTDLTAQLPETPRPDYQKLFDLQNDDGHGQIQIYQWGDGPNVKVQRLEELMDQLEDRTWEEFREPLLERLEDVLERFEDVEDRLDELDERINEVTPIPPQ